MVNMTFVCPSNITLSGNRIHIFIFRIENIIMRIISLLLLALIIIGFCACKTSKIGSDVRINPLIEDPYRIMPPNCIRIGPDLMVDKTEVSNIAYKEFMYWMKRVFGKGSPELLAIVPDTNMWKGTSLAHLSLTYLWDAPYNNFPMVGLSQTQAATFSKWRSDRVFEALLIERGYIPPKPDQNRENYFTIEKYLSGEYYGITPGEGIRYVPRYDLPTKSDFRAVISFFRDSMNYEDQRICKESHLAEDVELMVLVTGAPTRKINYNQLNGLYGNVAEWQKERNYVHGGSWIDSCEWTLNHHTRICNQPDVWIGFRNVCRWMEVKKDSTGAFILPD